jgi:AcrR family transcriptional regulator
MDQPATNMQGLLMPTIGTTTESGRQTAESIRREAAELFVSHGYEATSLRHIASAVGITVGSLYNHIDSKEDLLLQIMGGTMDDLLELQAQAIADKTDVIDQLTAALDCHVLFHAQRAQAVFIGNSELRSLPQPAREEIISKRRAYEAVFDDLIERAAKEGRADVLEPRLHTYSIVAKGSHVASWYKPDGKLTLDEIVRVYTTMSLRELGVAVPENSR